MKKLFILITVIAVTVFIWSKANNSGLHFALVLGATGCIAYLIRPVFSIRIKRNRAGE